MRPALSRPTGVGVYVQNLVEALANIDSENRYLLFSSSWKERFGFVPPGPNFKVHDLRWPVRLLNFGWNRLDFPPIEILLKTPIQIAHSPMPLVMPTRTARTVTTVHDLFFFTHPDQTVREMKTDYPRLLKEHCMRSNAIIADSDHIKGQLIDLIGVPSSHIYTIRLGVDDFYFEKVPASESSNTLKRFQISGSYVLFVGTQEPRKNLPVLIEAHRIHGEGMELVIAGPQGWGFNRPQPTPDIRWTGYISKSDLRTLYQNATVVVCPSVEEGFGLPLLEAMACQTPVIASRIPVFQEICNDSCLYFDPSNAEELAGLVRKVYEDSSLRDQLISKGKERVKKFTWKETARKTLELYRSL